MSLSDARKLIDRGRKAGLRTSELYAALNTRPRGTADAADGRADGNGFVSCCGQDGRWFYRPADCRRPE